MMPSWVHTCTGFVEKVEKPHGKNGNENKKNKKRRRFSLVPGKLLFFFLFSPILGFSDFKDFKQSHMHYF